MKLHYYLDRVDSLISAAYKEGLITKEEALILQNEAYSYDHLNAGLNWLTKKIDYLREG
jgi:hypothetical protein